MTPLRLMRPRRPWPTPTTRAELYGTDESANTAWLRYAQPFGKWLMRASLPISTVPVGGGQDPVSGLGDFNVFFAYLLSDPSSPKQFGIGPLLAAPTATDDVLGSDVWQAGAAAVYFNASSPVVQWGGLVTYQTDFAGDGGDTSLAVLQPFIFIQLGKGTYMGSGPLWIFNIEDSTYNVPLGIRLGKVVKSGRTVLNMFIEPQFTIRSCTKASVSPSSRSSPPSTCSSCRSRSRGGVYPRPRSSHPGRWFQIASLSASLRFSSCLVASACR